MSGGGGSLPPEPPHQAEEEEGWLLSFADLVVNMMALFLVLYSISEEYFSVRQHLGLNIG